MASRVALRACKLCLVPAGITASSRRFYEALGASCVPLLMVRVRVRVRVRVS